MKLYPDTKVYLLCPGNIQTGGPESLHQLASQLISFGVSAYMFYYPLGEYPFDKDNPVHDFYRKYHVPYVLEPEDNKKNILIAPEALTEGLYFYKKIQRVIWWMSVDNYLVHIKNNLETYLKNPLGMPLLKYFSFSKENEDVTHFAQSEYTRQFLRLNGIKKMYTVETHMSQTFLSRVSDVDLSLKKNFVAFNPRKGYAITNALMNLAPRINWKAIQNMTSQKVQALLAETKVYIDFGEFPGRERLPREAALSGCVVLVGKRGAAINDVDVNIPAEYKFDMKDTQPHQVIQKIVEVFNDFETAYAKQKAFQDKERNAQKNFVAEVAAAFEIKKSIWGNVALVQGLNTGTAVLLEKLKTNPLKPAFIVDENINDAENILCEQKRNYLRAGGRLIEIITPADAKFLYLEGRIKNFALLNPTDAELAEMKNFYAAKDEDLIIFNEQ